MGLINVKVDWDGVSFPDDTAGATILGGRWDGHVVEYQGQVVTYKGDRYVALRNADGHNFYLLESMIQQWFHVGR